MQGESPKLQKILSIFLALVTAIVVVFLAQVIVGLKSDVDSLKSALTLMRQEAARRVAVSEPFRVLEEKCIDCHSERKFTGVHGSSFELKEIVKKMETFPDAHITPQETDKIHNALVLLKCVRCHDAEGLNKLAVLTQERQRQVTIGMAEKPGSEISAEEAQEILRVYQKIQGF